MVGLLGAALYTPLWTGTTFSMRDAAVAAAGCVLLVWRRTPPLYAVADCAAAAVAAALY